MLNKFKNSKSYDKNSQFFFFTDKKFKKIGLSVEKDLRHIG
jgi:hypothetical protein